VGVLYWQLSELGVDCAVIAPTLAPVKVGDRVKADRRDAERLARSHRAGDLTQVWVPDAASKALRDLVRAREAAKQDQLLTGPRQCEFLLREGKCPIAGMRTWTIAYMTWVRQLRLAQPAQDTARLDYLPEVEDMSARMTRLEESIRDAVQQAPLQLQAVVQGYKPCVYALISAVTIASEIGAISRFQNARQLMSYSGTVPSENSSGKRTQRGGITKSGNAHLRRILGEAAWSYRRKPAIGPALRKRQEGVPEQIRQIAWKAQVRLCKRYARLQAANKEPGKKVTAVGREMLGFIWAIGLRAKSSIP
jgi:transposase